MNTVYKTILEKLSKLMAKAEAGTATPNDYALLKEGLMKLYDRVSALSVRSGLPQEEEVTSIPDIVDEGPEPVSEPPQQAPEPVAEVVEKEATPEPATESTPESALIAESTPEPATETEEALQPTAVAEEAVEVHERFKTDEADLSETLSQSPISELKAAISLNERLAFIEELFGGDTEAFETAIRRLNDAGSLSFASDIMNKELKHKFKWNNEVLVEEFAALVKRRYSEE